MAGVGDVERRPVVLVCRTDKRSTVLRARGRWHELTMEKLREIATLKLIGAPDCITIGLIVQQALLMGGVGFVAGTTLVSAMND